jgi:RNA polymerase sigma factor (sigma-70 family)
MTNKEFDKQYKDILGNLIAYLMKYSKCSFDDAFDVSQTVAINAYKYLVLNKKVITCSFKTFMYTCARNELVDFVRRHKINNKKEINYSSFFNDSTDSDFQVEDIFRTNLTDTTSQIVCNNETFKDLHRCIENLNATHPEYFSAFKLHLFEDLAYKECAEELNIPIGTVKSRIFKARDILKKNISETLKENILSN